MAQKSSYYWIINVINFVLFSVLSLTGLITWILPKGHGSDSLLINLKHFLKDIHEWTGFIFVVFAIIHIVVHWTYIKNNLGKYGIGK